MAVCRQHYRNGTTKENKFRLDIKYPPTFLRHVIEYKALIGRMNVIDVPVYSNPVTLTRRHIRIFRKSDVTMPGHNVTDFFLRHSRRNRQDIVVRFRLFTPDDVGNYTIHVRTHHHVTSATLILLGESPAAQ
uniref:Uncharacterized protein n=1 Tax=Ciona savignyi TaxID=51511 RepID=H2Y9U1_CIOSA